MKQLWEHYYGAVCWHSAIWMRKRYGRSKHLNRFILWWIGHGPFRFLRQAKPADIIWAQKMARSLGLDEG